MTRMFMRVSLRALTLTAVALLATGRPSHAQAAPEVPHCEGTKLQVEQLWCQGGAAFIQQTPAGYTASIAPNAYAVELEKRHRTLSRTAWLVLIDNLGMAYGITGDLAKARALFEYGLTKEPRYPMFHYNLACAYAEMGDEPKTIESLRHAFAVRDNIIAGEAMPDPATDDSFQRFMHDPKFLAALKALPGVAK